jgi:hypothetical protein
MSFGHAWALQCAIFNVLRADPEIASAVGDRIFDNPSAATSGGQPTILLGEERVAPWGSITQTGAEHHVMVSLLANEGGFGALKRLAGAVSRVVAAPLSVSGGQVVLNEFQSARSHRQGRAGLRRIDLQFRIIVEDDVS